MSSEPPPAGETPEARREAPAARGEAPEAGGEAPDGYKLPPWLELFKNCLMALLGLSLMAYAEWLSFEKEQSKREFFERQERIEDVQDRLQERLERARATRTPINFEEIWNSVDREIEERHRLEREAERAASTATPSSATPSGR